METSDWISLVSAILIGGGTLALAFMTWKSIRQTRSIQRAEKKERLLNEIIDWAVSVTKWRPKGSAKEMISTPENLKRRQLFSEVVGAIEVFVALRGRNQYAISISRTFGGALGKSVGKLIDTLEQKIKFLMEWRNLIYSTLTIDTKKAEAKDDLYFQKATKLENEIEQVAFKVIKEATKLKTRT